VLGYLQFNMLSTINSGEEKHIHMLSTAETCRHGCTNKLRYLDSCVVTDLPTLMCTFWLKGQFFSDLTLFLLRDCLQ